MNREALIVVDYQNDFAEGWSLAVTGAKALAPAIQGQMTLTRSQSGLIVATRDWHPEKTVHFQRDGGAVWPVHAVAGTLGSDYVSGIDTDMIDVEIYKGYKNSDDGYSGFEGVDRLSWDPKNGFELAPGARSLEEILRDAHISLLRIVWVATDFCVFATAKSGAELGYDVEVLRSGIAAVNAPWLPSGEDRLRELADMWVRIVP